jgi:hypothetical protein
MNTQMEKILVKVFLVVFFLLGVGGYVFIRDAEPKKIVMPSQAGTVIFDHVQHASEEAADIDCNMCHHQVKPCGECHNAQKEVSSISRPDAFHGNCGECHSEVEEEESCNMCHKTVGKNKEQVSPAIFDHMQHASEEAADIDCDMCHHTMPDETAKIRPCGKCHNAQKTGSGISRSDSFHKNCGECHGEVKESDSCDMCHKPT